MTQPTAINFELIGTIEHNETARRIAICFDAAERRLVSIDAQANIEDCSHRVDTVDQARVDFGLLWGRSQAWEPAAYRGWITYLNQVENSDDVYAVQAAGRVAGLEIDFAPALYQGDNNGLNYFRIEDAQANAYQSGIVTVVRLRDNSYSGPRETAAVRDENGAWHLR
jgi:hypothetical protein